MKSRPNFRAAFLSAMACALVVVWGATAPRPAEAEFEDPPGTHNAVQDKTSQDKSSQDADEGLVIEPAELPTTYPQAPYKVIFHGRGNYVPTLHWRVESGALPPGIALDDTGALQGQAERAGEFQFVVSVRDGGNPQQAVQKKFVIKVEDGIKVAWKAPAHVTGNRIDGSVEVSNMTPEDIDLTFEVKAVNENGRATEIGYQHFRLNKRTVGMALPFGETLPHGTYTVYVDVNGEIAKRNVVYKEQMKTPVALQVLVGP